MNALELTKFEDEDIELLENWLRQEYILKWYHEPEEWLREAQERHDEFCWITHFIVLKEGEPIGFCQYYPYEKSGETWNGDVPACGTYSIDYLIGEQDCLGKGLGKQIVKLLVNEIFSRKDAKRIIAQPEPENAASCYTLLSSGFAYDERNGLYLLSVYK